MIILLSPSKGQDFNPEPINSCSQPALLNESLVLVDILKTLKPAKIQQLMSISENLAELNYQRFQSFKTPLVLGQAKQAALAFKGDVYTGLDATSLSDDDWRFAQQHLRILSGLYGYLKPLDLILPYRLEMKTKLVNNKGENLYHFWGSQISNLINQELDGADDFVLNLASNEYFKAVKKSELKCPVLTLHFKDIKDGKARVIGFYAKKARGMMARALIQQKNNDKQSIQNTVVDGYQFDASLSTENDWVYTRKQPAPKT